MRIAHTSDWHAGRIFKQVPRLPELEDVLANLGDDLEREKIDRLFNRYLIWNVTLLWSLTVASAVHVTLTSAFRRWGR